MPSFEKQKYIIDYTLSSLLRRKGKNISLLVVYTFVIFLVASVMFLTNSIKREAALVLTDTPEMVVQRLVAGRHDLIPVSRMDAIKEIRGVLSVKSRLWGYYYDATNGANYTLVVKEDLHNTPGLISVGNGVVRSLLVKENKAIPFKTYDGSYLFLEIKDVFPAESELVSSDLILISEADFRKIFSLPEGMATDLVLTVRNTRELPTIATKIKQLFPDTRPILREEIFRTYDAVLDWRGGLLIVILSGAVFAFVILAWDRATGLGAEEKREIGILKALGWETSDILTMKFWEGAVISSSAFSLGILLAYVHVFFGSFILFESTIKGWSTLYPHFRLTPFINLHHLLSMFFLTVVPYTVTTIIPSWRAATIDPDSVMRA